MREDDGFLEYVCCAGIIACPFVTLGMIAWAFAIFFDLY